MCTHGTRTLAGLAALLVLAGCVGTPQPDPPNLDTDLLNPSRTRGGEFELAGAPGAVTPPGAVLHIVNLDSTLDPVVVTPDSDGGFLTTVLGEFGDELRLQVTREEQRSRPVDLEYAEDGLRPASRPLAGCFTTSPSLELATVASGRATLTLINDCDELVSLSTVAPRRAGAGVTVADAPTGLAAGASEPVLLDLGPPWGTGFEEVLMIEVSAPELDRRPVTLYIND